MKTVAAVCFLLLSGSGFIESARADWHQGTVQIVAFPYEGDRAVFGLTGVIFRRSLC